jgi:Predicted sugar kinase
LFHGIAINEIVVRRLSSLTMKTRVDLDKEFFENFRGDGLCFATPTGPQPILNLSVEL